MSRICYSHLGDAETEYNLALISWAKWRLAMNNSQLNKKSAGQPTRRWLVNNSGGRLGEEPDAILIERCGDGLLIDSEPHPDERTGGGGELFQWKR